MSAWRPVALAAAVAAGGAAGTLAVGALLGMSAGEVAHLALLLLPAAAVTVLAAAAARPLLARTSFSQRLLAVVLTAALVSLANLGALAALMFVSSHDAILIGVLLVYSAGAGAGAALAISRGQTLAVRGLAATAGELADGNLEARAGNTGGGRELEALARALDRMAESLQRSLDAERAGERQRRDLITAVSHDLRTPLAGLRAMVEAIEDGVVDDPPTFRRYAAEMRRQVESVAVLVDDLFELVQLDAGAIEAESERARLQDVIASAVKACDAQLIEKGLVLERRLDGAGDSLCSPRVVRVLQNLLQNAIRHTPSDGTVRIEARRRPGGLEVVVEDTGEGIEPEALGRVFEPFWRGEAARSSPGAGLGLALAKRIVEALGGDIRVQSASRSGSRFAVRLPDST
ncbi:MAG: HAMP domain-containing sensor histidine kinase [Actinomycetota bacterium]